MTEAANAADNATLVDTISGALHPIRRAAFGLGSNVGERAETLQGAVDALLDSPGIEAFGVSAVYETSPVGGPEQDDYLNAVLVVDTTLAPQDLLDRAHAVEEAFGRDRPNEERWGPRTLDIDVLAVGDRVAPPSDDAEAAVLPHPRLHERAFVLVPWSDVDPSFEVPGLGRVAELAAAVGAPGVRRRIDLALDLT